MEPRLEKRRRHGRQILRSRLRGRLSLLSRPWSRQGRQEGLGPSLGLRSFEVGAGGNELAAAVLRCKRKSGVYTRRRRCSMAATAITMRAAAITASTLANSKRMWGPKPGNGVALLRAAAEVTGVVMMMAAIRMASSEPEAGVR